MSDSRGQCLAAAVEAAAFQCEEKTASYQRMCELCLGCVVFVYVDAVLPEFMDCDEYCV